MTNTEIVSLLIVGALFFLLFKAQQKIFPQHYFASSQLVVGVPITYRMILIRIFLTFLFGILTFLVVQKEKVILLGVLFGSFLIVWPALSAPYKVYAYIETKQIPKIILSHFIFVITSVGIVKAAIISFPYITDVSIEKIKDFPGDAFIWLIIVLFGYPGQEKINQILDKEANENFVRYEEDEKES